MTYQMNPEDFCQLTLKLGTQVSLVSLDYGGVEWSYKKRIKGTLQSYVVLERHNPAISETQANWDTAARMALPSDLQVIEDGQEYSGNELLLIHRTARSAWDDEGWPVWVFGIRPETPLNIEPLPLAAWRPKTVLLSYGASLLMEDTTAPSAITRAFQAKDEQG